MATQENNTVKRTFQIPAENLTIFLGKIDELNRRAKRMKQQPITITRGPVANAVRMISTKVYGAFGQTEWRDKPVTVELHEITVEGQSPQITGWTLVSRLQYIDGSILAHSVPGETCPAKYRDDWSKRCDHCNTNRTRKDMFIVRDEAGKHICVGRNCVKDFTGHVSPNELAFAAEWLHSVSELGNEDNDIYSGGEDARLQLTDLLACAACAIRNIGWVSKKAADQNGTKPTVTIAMTLLCGKQPEGVSVELIVDDKDQAMAEAAIEWAKQINPLGDNDYLLNLRSIAQKIIISGRISGLAVSLVSAYQREIGIVAARKKMAEESRHVGEVGSRDRFNLTVEKIIDIIGHYGMSHIHLFRDDHGNVMKWKSSRERLDTGKTYQVKGTIKSHDLYADIKQTCLSRCVCVEAAR